MQYQLPSGKVVFLTLEQYLDLTDEDIQYLMSINFGEYVSSPWHGSATKNSSKTRKESDPEPHDRSIDFTDEDETRHEPRPILPDEGYSELSDISGEGLSED